LFGTEPTAMTAMAWRQRPLESVVDANASSTRAAFEVVAQRCRDAHGDCVAIKLLADPEQDGSIAVECEPAREKRAKRSDEPCEAMKIYRNVFRACGFPADPHGAATARLRGDVRRLALA
jgi:hypothetical protein